MEENYFPNHINYVESHICDDCINDQIAFNNAMHCIDEDILLDAFVSGETVLWYEGNSRKMGIITGNSNNHFQILTVSRGKNKLITRNIKPQELFRNLGTLG